MLRNPPSSLPTVILPWDWCDGVGGAWPCFNNQSKFRSGARIVDHENLVKALERGFCPNSRTLRQLSSQVFDPPSERDFLPEMIPIRANRRPGCGVADHLDVPPPWPGGTERRD